jgi:hypothetical protein
MINPEPGMGGATTNRPSKGANGQSASWDKNSYRITSRKTASIGEENRALACPLAHTLNAFVD